MDKDIKKDRNSNIRNVQDTINTKNTTSKNLAIIGYGGMGKWHAEHALKSDVVRLSGVYDIDPARQADARDRGIKSYTSLEALLNDKAVELVTIAVPNDIHKELALKALEAGKHVILEKPAMLSLADMEEAIHVADEKKLILTAHQNRRWDIDFTAISRLAKGNELGDIISIESRVHGSRGIPSDWRGMKAYGGGMLYDWGAHLIDQMLLLIREPVERVYCRFDHITNKEVDDGFHLVLYFEGGKTAYLEVGTYNFISMPRFYVRGSKGSAIITDWWKPCRVVQCKYWHENDVLPVKVAAGVTKTMAPRDSITVNEYEFTVDTPDVHDFYRNVCKAIDGEEELIVTHNQMLNVLAVIEAAFDSAASGQPAVLKYIH